MLAAAFSLVGGGHVLDTRLADGRYLILLRSGPEPAEWLETTALRYWYQTAFEAVVLGVVLAGVAHAVLYFLKRAWDQAQETREADN